MLSRELVWCVLWCVDGASAAVKRILNSTYLQLHRSIISAETCVLAYFNAELSWLCACTLCVTVHCTCITRSGLSSSGGLYRGTQGLSFLRGDLAFLVHLERHVVLALQKSQRYVMSRVRPLLLACAASYLNHSINDKEMRSLCLANKKRQVFPRNESHLAGNICFTASFLAFYKRSRSFLLCSRLSSCRQITWHGTHIVWLRKAC